MSLSITNSMSLITPQPARELSEAKSEAIDKLHSKEQQLTAQLQSSQEKASTRLGSIEQYAQDNDYSHLASFANKAADAVNSAVQHASARVEQRFDVTENLLLQRPEGGYTLSAEKAATMIEKIEQHTASRLAALDEKNSTMNERLAGFKNMAIENGHDADHIDALSDKMQARMEQSMERLETRSDKAIELIQSRIDVDVNDDVAPVDDPDVIYEQIQLQA